MKDYGATLALIYALLSTLPLGGCIKCNVCNTLRSDDGCDDPFKSKAYLKECEDAVKDPLDNNTPSPDKKMSFCMKLAEELASGEVVVERGCTINPIESIGSCEEVRQAMHDANNANVTVRYCQICNTDGCNVGTTGGPSLASAALSLATTLALSKATCKTVFD